MSIRGHASVDGTARAWRGLPCSTLLLASCVLSSIAWPRLAPAAPLALSGTTATTPPNDAIFKLSAGETFTAVLDLDVRKAVGGLELVQGLSGERMRYAGIDGSIEANFGGVSWLFTPLFLVVGNDVIEDAANVSSSAVDFWHLHAQGPQGLLLTIGLWQRNGSAIDQADAFVPDAPDAFASATWALFAPAFDPATGQQLPRLDNIASGRVETWTEEAP